MYGWIWRHLPGPIAMRAVIALILIAGVIALLLFVVFPWVDPRLPAFFGTGDGTTGQ